MSRCFPFPPPGYEKKARIDEENLLEKEEHKEKKHRKDKKEKKHKKDKKGKKDKSREVKQKKDKERSNYKHSEKKHRKEKHKDKKDKHREKDNKRTSDEKNIVGLPLCCNNENPGSNQTQGVETGKSILLWELGERIRDKDEATQGLMFQKINLTGQRRIGLAGKVVGSTINNLVEGIEKHRNKREDDKNCEKSSEVDVMGKGNGSVSNFIGNDQKRVGAAGLASKYVEKTAEQKANDEQNRSISRRDKCKDKDREKKRKSLCKRREKKKEEDVKTKDEEPFKEQLKAGKSCMSTVYYNTNGKSSLKEKENNNCNLGKRKQLEINGFLDDEIWPNKLPKPLSSSHDVENGRKLELCNTSTQYVSESMGMYNNHKVNNKASSSHPVAENGFKFESPPANIQFGPQGQGTRNNHEANNSAQSCYPFLENKRPTEMFRDGIQFASEWLGISNDHKMNNKVSFSHPVLENGRTLEASQTATNFTGGGHSEAAGNHKVDEKGPKINGSIEDQKRKVCSTMPLTSPVQAIKNVGESPKPPHPDSKYLSHILAIPNIEWSDLDDQEWLIGSSHLKTNIPRSGSFPVDGAMQVWAEALRVESADITILPYVIPY